MNITIRPMLPSEHKYSYSQSPNLMACTGCIGHLRGNMGSNGLGFYTSWDDHQPDLKTTDFKAELDTVINALRFDVAYGGVLAGRDKLSAYCCAHPDSRMDEEGRNFGFRADTDRYTYMLRLNPHRGEYNLYVYCYVREQLDGHLDRAGHGIRFVSSHYWDLFRLTDGDHNRPQHAGCPPWGAWRQACGKAGSKCQARAAQGLGRRAGSPSHGSGHHTNLRPCDAPR